MNFESSSYMMEWNGMEWMNEWMNILQNCSLQCWQEKMKKVCLQRMLYRKIAESLVVECADTNRPLSCTDKMITFGCLSWLYSLFSSKCIQCRGYQLLKCCHRYLHRHGKTPKVLGWDSNSQPFLLVLSWTQIVFSLYSLLAPFHIGPKFSVLRADLLLLPSITLLLQRFMNLNW